MGMESISGAAAYAASQVTQVAEAQGIYALKMANSSGAASVLSLIHELPDLGAYNSQGSPVSSSTTGSRLSVQA